MTSQHEYDLERIQLEYDRECIRSLSHTLLEWWADDDISETVRDTVSDMIEMLEGLMIQRFECRRAPQEVEE